jgi:hypothetical protein
LELAFGNALAGQLVTSAAMNAQLDILNNKIVGLSEQIASTNSALEDIKFLLVRPPPPKAVVQEEPPNEVIYSVEQTQDHGLFIDLGTKRKLYVNAYGNSDAPLLFTLSMSDDMDHWFTVHTQVTNCLVFTGGRLMQYVRFTSGATEVAGKVSMSLSAMVP